jgi:uncharacterized membrane protein YbhN (UPF0104 family)
MAGSQQAVPNVYFLGLVGSTETPKTYRKAFEGMIGSRIAERQSVAAPDDTSMQDSETGQSRTFAARQDQATPSPGQAQAPESLTSAVEAAAIHHRAISKAREIRHRLPKSLKLKIKILFSLLMFGSLPFILKIDLQKTWSAILHTNPWTLGATILFFLGVTALNAKRWQIICHAVGLDKPLAELTEYYYVAMFFNLFLPSTVGGDFSRCYYVSKGTGKYKDAFYSVLADRASGIAILFITATIGILVSPGAASLPWQLKWPIFAGTFALFVVMPFMPFLTARVLGENNWIAKQFNNSSAQIFWKDKKLILASLGWSALIQLCMVICHFGVAASMGIADKVPLWYYFIFYPCVAVLGFVTPSFNGIGIREWAYTYFLMLMGVSRENGLTYALMWLMMITLLSFVGGIIYAAAKLAPPPPQEDD